MGRDSETQLQVAENLDFIMQHFRGYLSSKKNISTHLKLCIAHATTTKLLALLSNISEPFRIIRETEQSAKIQMEKCRICSRD